MLKARYCGPVKSVNNEPLVWSRPKNWFSCFRTKNSSVDPNTMIVILFLNHKKFCAKYDKTD